MESFNTGVPPCAAQRPPRSLSGRHVTRRLAALAFYALSGTALAQALPDAAMSAAGSTSQRLTLEQALRAAQVRSQALVAQHAAAGAAREMAVVARQLPDPGKRLATPP